MQIRPTRRGAVVVGIVVGSGAMAIPFGTRSLDVIIAAGIVALGIALAQLVWYDRPAVERTPPPPDHVGSTDEVGVTVDPSAPMVLELSDSTGDGIATTMPDRVAIEDTASIEYRLMRARRGIHQLGPLTLRVFDTFGLFARRFEYDRLDDVVVYPPIAPVEPPDWLANRHLATEFESRYRERFDGIREYTSGDALRDIHWPSSAKRSTDTPTFIVQTFADSTDRASIVLAGEATSDRADPLAATLAGLAVPLLERGVPVGVRVPDGSVPPETEAGNRRAILRLLARTGGGTLEESDRRDATAVVRVETDDSIAIVPGSGGGEIGEPVRRPIGVTMAGGESDP